ncbi:MAG: type 4a pilus biogenesis protein PilO [Rhodocyclaceae bacterium]|nr:type 4a pilus biogenesis protein PilO [Rhodocyclaceae bacterium]GIK25411.1 MAG: fimbrial protein [Betaproteobacteria bacterium]
MKKPNMPQMPAVPKIDFKALAEDFKSLDPKDIGTWPLLPRVTVLLGVFAALLVGGWWFDWKSQLEELEGKRQQEAKLKDEYLDKKRQAVNLEEHRKQLAEIDKTFGSLLKQLPNKAEMEALLIDINQAGLGRGLQFELFKPGRETTRDFYAELPITLKITGTYHDLGAFSADVAKLSRIVSLTNIAVVPDKGGQLKMDATAMTYRYLDEEELAAQRRAKSQAKGAKK